MIVVNGKMMLRAEGLLIYPGEKAELSDKTAEQLIRVGLVEKATKSPPEKAVMPPARESKKPPEEMTKNQLVKELNVRGIEHNKRQIKSQLIDLLRGD